MFAYFVTGVTYEDKEFKDRKQRCFGYFETFKEAEKTVLNNCCDIWEAIHEYVVIEKIEDGIHQFDLSPTWYKWNLEKEEYEKVDRPDFAQ